MHDIRTDFQKPDHLLAYSSALMLQLVTLIGMLELMVVACSSCPCVHMETSIFCC